MLSIPYLPHERFLDWTEEDEVTDAIIDELVHGLHENNTYYGTWGAAAFTGVNSGFSPDCLVAGYVQHIGRLMDRHRDKLVTPAQVTFYLQGTPDKAPAKAQSIFERVLIKMKRLGTIMG